MANDLKKNFLHFLEELERMEDLKAINRFGQELQRLRSRLSDDEFRIAVVGEFSSGKSTFINALLGQDLLRHATTETTAALTRIVNTPSDSLRSRTGRVQLKNGDDITLSDFRELSEYTTTASKKYNVVNQVAEVELYLPVFPSKRSIVLVDTPGLNGTADGHREQTVNLIQQAHSCIYLLSRRGLTDIDVQFLNYLSHYQKNFLFVQNFIDDFRRSEGENLEEKLAAQREILEQKVFAEADDCQYEICGISALKALAAKDANIEKLYDTSTRPLTPEDRVTLYQQSNFEEFRGLMAKTFSEERLEDLQYGDTAKAIHQWTQSLLEQLERRAQQTNEIYLASKDRRTIEKLAALKEKVLASEKKQSEYLTNFVSSECTEIQKNVQEKLESDLAELARQQTAAISRQQTLKSAEQYGKDLSSKLENAVGQIIQSCNENCENQFKMLYQVLLTRIESYSGINVEPEGWSYSLHNIKRTSFRQDEGQIERLKQRIQQQQEQRDQYQLANGNLAREIGRAACNLRASEREMSNIESRRRAQLNGIGSRPKVEERGEYYTASEYRGGFGIIDFFCGPKQVTHYRTVLDDSARRNWDAKKAKIENEYHSQKDKAKGRLDAAKRSLRMLEANQKDNKDRIDQQEQRIQELTRHLAAEESALEAKKKHAAEEYLRYFKNDLIRQVTEYLTGGSGVIHQTEEDIRREILSAEQNLSDEAVRLFHNAIRRKLAGIDLAVQNKQPEILRQARHLEQTRMELAALKEKMEECFA